MLDRIDKLMPSSLNRGNIAGRVKTAIIADTALKVLADKFGEPAKQMKVRRFKAGVVTVICENSVLSEEIHLFEPDLIREINKLLGEDRVERIVATT